MGSERSFLSRSAGFVSWRLQHPEETVQASLRGAYRYVRHVKRRIWLDHVARSRLIPMGLRGELLKLAGLDVRSRYVSYDCFFGIEKLHIGANTYINFGCVFEGDGTVVIGERSMIGPGVMFVTSHHVIRDDGAVTLQPTPTTVTVGERVWLGSRVVLLPGVTIGDGAVVAAGSVVSKDCEAGGLYGGMPARLIRKLTPETR